MIALLPACVFAPLMLAAGAGDAMTMRIPNWLTGLIALAFFPLAIGSGLGAWLIGQHMAVGAALLLLGFVLFSFGFIGGGDAKLLAAAGLWFGYPSVLPFVMYTALAGGVLAIVIGLWFMLRWHAEIWGLSRGPPARALSPDVPYGLALAAGALFASQGAWWMGPWR
ncbi:MAG: prepilin peptidase [Aestuariivirga sp.]|uniref:A24 family peptidase n=1 Tax=Aestuariivirga sp. TaxID=2650926 RepID=UPI0038D09702